MEQFPVHSLAETKSCSHVMEIKGIPPHIFKFCKRQEMTTCPPVCRECESLTIEEWSSKVTVEITIQTISEFLKFIEKEPSKNNFANFSFLFNSELPLCEHIFTLCGSKMKSLVLKSYTFANIDCFRKLICDWTPNLEKLVIQDFIVNQVVKYDESVKETNEWTDIEFWENWSVKSLSIDLYALRLSNFHISWMELLNHFPGLEEILVEDSNSGNKLDEIFRSLAVIRQRHPSKLKLKKVGTLKVYGDSCSGFYDRSGVFRILCDSSLRLEAISIGINSLTGASVLVNTLIMHWATLQKLEVEKRDDSGTGPEYVTYTSRNLDPMMIFVIPGTNFETLTEISLRCRVFSSFTFLKFTPNLAILKMSIFDRFPSIVAQTDMNAMEKVKLIKCKEFEYKCNTQLRKTELQCLIDWLPNVEKLTVSLDNDTFPLVCQNWTNIVSLNVSDSWVSEGALTGFDEEYVKLMNLNELLMDLMNLNSNNQYLQRSPTVSKANITCLRKLKTLVLIAHQNYRAPLGYAAMKFGFMELPNLTQLSIQGYLVDKITWHQLNVENKKN